MSDRPAPTKLVAYTSPRPDVLQMVPAQARRILDVGCSNGAFGEGLKRRSPTSHIVGVEFDRELASQAESRIDEVICADVNALDWSSQFQAQSFDCIVMADVLEHLVDPPRHLRAVRRLLEPGGSVVVSLPNIRHLSSMYAIFVGGRFPRRDRGIFDRTHLRWFTLSDAEGLLREAGYTVAARGHALRFGDRGGGRMNRLLNRLPARIVSLAPIREFLTYQVCYRAIASA